MRAYKGDESQLWLFTKDNPEGVFYHLENGRVSYAAPSAWTQEELADKFCGVGRSVTEISAKTAAYVLLTGQWPEETKAEGDAQ